MRSNGSRTHQGLPLLGDSPPGGVGPVLPTNPLLNPYATSLPRRQPSSPGWQAWNPAARPTTAVPAVTMADSLPLALTLSRQQHFEEALCCAVELEALAAVHRALARECEDHEHLLAAAESLEAAAKQYRDGRVAHSPAGIAKTRRQMQALTHLLEAYTRAVRARKRREKGGRS